MCQVGVHANVNLLTQSTSTINYTSLKQKSKTHFYGCTFSTFLRIAGVPAARSTHTHVVTGILHARTIALIIWLQ